MSLSIFLDQTFDKNRLKILVLWTFQHYGEERTWEISERLKNLGFHIATKAGFSIGIENLLIPKEKRWGLQLTERKVRKSKIYEILGATTLFETEERLITGFRITSENLKETILTIFQNEDSLNPLYIMSFSGARGNITQIQQLIGIRGLIIDPISQVIKSPIRSNFKEGITLTEFLISCYGARKGIIDTALRTAKAGYLTRRLVDISHFQVVSIEDCSTRRRIRIFPLIDEFDRILFPLNERIRGRSLSYPIPKLGHRNLFLDFALSQQIRKKYPFALFRSPLLCRAPFFSILRQIQFNSKEYIKKKEKKKNSYFLPWSIKNKNIYSTICQYCYGWNLADRNLVNIGEAIGILAAQSIGEPGTQLTIRTFHTGGVFSSGIFDRLHRSIYGKISFPSVIKGRLSRSRTGQIGFLTREKGSICIQTQLKKKENVKRKTCRFSVTIRVKFSYIYKEHMEEEIILPKRILLLVRQGEWIGSKSNIAFLGITKFLCKDEVQIRTYRIPYRRELFFEDVSLNLLCSIIESQDLDLIPPEKLFFFLSLESYKKIRAINSSRILLKSSELMGKDKNFSCPFLFSWKQGDLLSKNSSLTKIRVKKPVNYLIFIRVKDKKQ